MPVVEREDPSEKRMKLPGANHRAVVLCAAPLSVAVVWGPAVQRSTGAPAQSEAVSGEHLLIRASVSAEIIDAGAGASEQSAGGG